MRIAMVQMTALRNEKELNLLKMEEFIKRASKEKASIICFPELSITGYVKKDPVINAESLDGHSLNRLKELSKTYDLTILAGLTEIENDNVYISHVSIQPDSDIEVYRKTHLGSKEKKTFTQGNEIPVFHTLIEGKKSKYGIGLCYDLHYPELVTSLAVQGAKIVFAPHAVPIGGLRRLAIWEKYMPARAYDNGVYVLACNLVGNDGEKDFGGGIGVWNPKGECIIACHEEKELMMMLDLDLDIFSKKGGMGKTAGFLEDRRIKLYLDSAGFSIEGNQLG